MHETFQPKDMNRRQFLKAAGIVGLSSFFRFSHAAPNGGLRSDVKRPNILFLNVDQMGHFALSCHGNPYVNTPNIDRLAARGIDFSKSYTPDPICCPARSAWCTGRYGSENNVVINNRPLRKEFPDYGQWLGARGYETAHIGKWHVVGRPLHKSFQWVPHNSHSQGEYSDNLIALSFESFLAQRDRSKPFFAQVGLMNPHDCGTTARRSEHPFPFEHLRNQLPPRPPNFEHDPLVPEQLARMHKNLGGWVRSFSEEQLGHHQWLYYRLCEMVDTNVGYILDTLERSPDYENTVVVFTSDHGEGNGFHGLLFKDHFYEESVRVPTMVHFPGCCPEGVLDDTHLVSGLDFFPTFCDYAGIEAPAVQRGRSLRPLVEQKQTDWRRYVISQSKATGRMIVDERFKFVRYRGSQTVQLFDLQNDPLETKNVAYKETHKGDVARLGAEIDRVESTLDNVDLPASLLNPLS